jgi:quinol monooxygenase YgiN
MVIEKWSSLEALQAHAAAPHMAAYAAKARPHIANRVVHVLSTAF